jgi:hypothetical protein
MEELKKANVRFKILHKEKQFVIGSNNSNDRGEVIQFSK